MRQSDGGSIIRTSSIFEIKTLRRQIVATLDEYANKYQRVRMERRDGILQITLHTNGAACNGAALRTKSCLRRSTT